jgi:hypothetical protein
MKKGFFAYSSEPKYCGETIEEAIIKINESYSGITELKSWLSLKIAGKLIISEILKEIDSCDYFCADLTGLNDNVLFELGYAIAKKKLIWIIIDKSNLNSNKRFQELNFFTTIGYSNYSNSSDLIRAFSDEEIFKSDIYLLDSLTSNIRINQGENALFYIKSQVDTNYSQDIINQIEFLKLPYRMDDPVETKIHPLTWYMEQIFSVPALLVEFSSNYRVGHELHNSKCAFISGLSLGFGLSLLMVSEKPHPTPIDYRELLKKHSDRKECNENIKPFLKEVHNDIAQLLVKRRKRISKQKKVSELQKINFGEFIAEHETETLYDLYIETSHYQNLIKSEHNIVIGRKGTGKTATLYYLEQVLENDVRNHICLIKPVNFEIDGLIAIHDNLKDEFEKGYMIEAIWKFLVYTEISKSLYNVISVKPMYSLTEDEDNFISYVKENSQIILTDFSTRLEQELEKLSVIVAKSQGEFRIKISEILHQNIIRELRNHIKNNIRNKGKLVVLVDNLDKSWKKNKSLNVLSKYILGLLGVVGRIATEFRGTKNDPVKFTFHMTLFLRSDIFKYIMKSAREPDKIEFTRLLWRDSEILLRMIETRFEQLSSKTVFADELWDKYIVTNVSGMNAKEYIISSIFPRPRDLIYFLTSAKNIAVSRGHEIVEAADIIAAHADYSNWVFKSILVENGITITQIEDFMYNLMGENEILSEERIKELAQTSSINVDSKEDLEHFIDNLVSLTVFGREVKESVFEFEYEFDSDIKLKALANKMETKNYKIHNALIPYLEINN